MKKKKWKHVLYKDNTSIIIDLETGRGIRRDETF